MAFDRTNIALADAGQNSGLPRRWSYTTTDTDTQVSTSGYFNNAADLLSVGDVVTVNADTDGSPVYGRVLVNANDGTTVDVSDIEAFTTTDTE